MTHLLVVNLAVAHFLLPLICTPLDAGYLLTSGRWLTDGHGCRFQRFASTILTSAAILTLSAIAVDRQVNCFVLVSLIVEMRISSADGCTCFRTKCLCLYAEKLFRTIKLRCGSIPKKLIPAFLPSTLVQLYSVQDLLTKLRKIGFSQKQVAKFCVLFGSDQWTCRDVQYGRAKTRAPL